MTRFLRLAAVAALAVLPAACNTSSQGGHPGTGAGSAGKSADTFTVSGPVLATSIKQGDRQTVKLTLTRGSDFRQAVKLKADAPKGLTADLASKTVNPSDPAEVNLSIEADKDATPGDYVIKVIATPDSGTETTLDVKVSVAKRN